MYIMFVVTMYCMGTRSKIYSAAILEKLNVRRRFESFCARYMTMSEVFHSMADATDEPTLNLIQLKQCLYRVFRHSLDSGELETSQVDALALILLQGFDEDNDGFISLHEFVQRASESEVIQIQDIVEHLSITSGKSSRPTLESQVSRRLERALTDSSLPSSLSVSETLKYTYDVERSKDRGDHIIQGCPDELAQDGSSPLIEVDLENAELINVNASVRPELPSSSDK
eukprot:gnl/TRDRNA2_/TRDRNA2_205870_c0_seq1.p1 gnl/TRDRNA2_/TRDRNA2_205870_c0~~gnl/TRDRNA2_/TRDRNA2_205870_c0_seq1.p1  ORF type:complete len:228 (-),score=18.98 gnl/TRDRNA2_/TRDRNA2_205870_c0_seq1:120-803(-)